MPGDIDPWRLGVVLQISREKAVVGLRPQRRQDGSLVADRLAAEIPYDEVKWANKKPGKQPGANDVLNVGDVIYVAPKDPDNLQGAWSLMQIPEVGGGMVVMDPHTGRVLAIVGGFSFASASSTAPDRRAASPVRRSSRSSTLPRSTTATSRPASSSTPRSPSSRAPASTSGSRATTADSSMARRLCASASSTRAT